MAKTKEPETNQDFILNIKVQPRATNNKIAGYHDGALKLALTAAPVDGAANQACIELLAKSLGIKKAQVEIKSGLRSCHKLILLKGIDKQQIQLRLKEILPDGENN
ncbi:MAG: DUF167 domain-containing protein [Candidatus Schekmanbacteria bacterium]|nr:DUF167 domain-containing protein [Candidatus Schekmanbacteria bacterium]